MTQPLYHFTDTARLPWILRAHQLEAGRNQIGGYPVDFLWATTDPRGDATSAATMNQQAQAWRSGLVQKVRFTLAAEDFEPWPAILERYPQWTAEQVAALERLATSRGVSPSTWRCRAAPLPRERWLAVETRSYVSKWKTFDHHLEIDECGGDSMAICLDGSMYCSQQIIKPGQPTGYQCVRMPVEEFALARVLGESE
jgi:hypothetical protein